MSRARKETLPFRAEVDAWAARTGLRPRRIQLQRMTKKWASCSTSGRITFSTDLLREDAAFRQLVIVHELLHLRVPNHGKLFTSLLSAYLPGWQRIADGRVARRCGFQNGTTGRRPHHHPTRKPT